MLDVGLGEFRGHSHPGIHRPNRIHRKVGLVSFRLSPRYPTKGIHSPSQLASLFSRSYHSRLSILLLAVVNIYKVLTTCWAPCQGHTYFISLNPFNKVTKGAIIIFSLHLRLREVSNSMSVPWVVTEEGPRNSCLSNSGVHGRQGNGSPRVRIALWGQEKHWT